MIILEYAVFFPGTRYDVILDVKNQSSRNEVITLLSQMENYV